MAAEVKGDSEPYDTINITPMVDLTFVLLLIFIIMTTASVQGVKVNLPQASSAASLAAPKTKAVTITADGNVFLDTYPVTLPELESRLASLYAADPELPVVIKGDSTVQYQLVMDVLDLTGRVGITQIGLVTQKLVK
ncbi:MAG: biopolymer transporter ExbD [Proteobacteria bacterium]|jgi:biopolymer transport protein ExbD|nr:biopolymer transporter ExbD [Pseudomonadota bacterium]